MLEKYEKNRCYNYEMSSLISCHMSINAAEYNASNESWVRLIIGKMDTPNTVPELVGSTVSHCQPMLAVLHLVADSCESPLWPFPSVFEVISC